MRGGERGRHDPPRRPRRLLRVGRAAGRPAPARPAGDRRRRRRAGGQLRGQGVRRLRRDGRGPGAPAVPARDRRPAAHGGLLGGEQGGVRGVRRHDAARRGAVDRRGVPRRRRAAAGVRHAGGDRRCGCGATCASGSACRSRSGWRGRSSSPRWRAAWPSPTACSSCRPAASWRSSTRCRSSGCGASGRRPPASSTTRGITTVADVARLPEGALVSMLGRASGATSTPSPTTAIPGPCEVGAGAGRSARSAPSVAEPQATPTRSTPSLVGLVDRVTRRMRAAGGSAGR